MRRKLVFETGYGAPFNIPDSVIAAQSGGVASRSISAPLLVYIPAMAEGRCGWEGNETLQRAVNIDRGVIQKPGVAAFQARQAAYPHAPLADLAAWARTIPRRGGVP